MANLLFPKTKEQMLQGGINLSSATVKLVIVDEADLADSSAHDFLDDIPGGARIAISPALTSKTYTDGTFDSADVTVTAVSGDPFERVYLFIDTGVEATSRLISRHDCTGTPNGSDYTIVAPAGGWFSL